MLFFFESPALKTGSWAQQSTTGVAYDNQIYCVHYIRMASNDLGNNYYHFSFNTYCGGAALQVCRPEGRMHTHTETLLQIPPQERESNGHKKVNSKSRARCRRWCVVSASMGCVGDTELCTDKSEESHYPFNFTSPFWKIQAHNLFLYTIMNVSNHQDLLILEIVSTIPSSTWVKSRISTHVSLKIFMSSASQGPIKPTSLQVDKKHLLFELSTLVRKVYVTIFSWKEEVKIQFKFYEYHDRDSWLSIHCLGQQLNQVLLAMLLSPPISSLLPLF